MKKRPRLGIVVGYLMIIRNNINQPITYRRPGKLRAGFNRYKQSSPEIFLLILTGGNYETQKVKIEEIFSGDRVVIKVKSSVACEGGGQYWRHVSDHYIEFFSQTADC